MAGAIVAFASLLGVLVYWGVRIGREVTLMVFRIGVCLKLLPFACLYVATWFAFSGDAVFLLLALPLIWMSATDLDAQRIPDLANLGVAIFGLGWVFYSATATVALIEFGFAVAAYAVFWGLGEIYWRRTGEEALGIGDAKLIGAGVLCCGADMLWFFLFLASIAGICGTLFLSWRRGGAVRGIAFGPYLAYAIFVVALMGQEWSSP
ncbi:prepilin peptidase [Neogemmobacter tilapiae]|uniref:Prepilin type IV endopeptidase peptidase domain-containing protein n=1 Tax=Neogemmobacter tilapiae TaxID=875041 RepID=A0A918TX05_9RHOB|nr:A24 family peptidase [Gemmobacter tilapiae]GHC65515.1 hypothetical protein GCM10007315_32670 [Gemmobacter tilapiae]